MNLVTVAVKNVARNKLRTLLTAMGVAVAVVAFVLLRTVIWSWGAMVEQSASDRIGIRHKVTFVMTMPKRYAEEVRLVPGVSAVAYANWFGAKDPKHETEFFQTLAVEPADILTVYKELEVKPEQAEAWKQNRRGAMVGDVIAKKLGWKIGDRVTLRGTIYPGDWEFEIAAIYTARRAAVDRSTLYFHWNYMNDAVDATRRDQIGWIVARIDDPGKTGGICRSIDAKFGERDVQTLCMSERSMTSSFLGMFSAVLKAIDVVSIVILAIMMLILGNTIAMGVRERTNEYGVLRAIGFVPRHIVLFIVGEAVTLGVIGGLLGLAGAYLFVDLMVGRWVEENLGAWFAFFSVQPELAALAIVLAIGLSLFAAAIPAYRAAGLKVVDSLRRVG